MGKKTVSNDVCVSAGFSLIGPINKIKKGNFFYIKEELDV